MRPFLPPPQPNLQRHGLRAVLDSSTPRAMPRNEDLPGSTARLGSSSVLRQTLNNITIEPFPSSSTPRATSGYEDHPKTIAQLGVAQNGAVAESKSSKLVIQSHSSRQPSNDVPTASSETPSFQLKEFTWFAKLPKEMREKIWNHAAAIPRNVDIWIGPEDRGTENSMGLSAIEHFYYCSTKTPPAVLSTCHESRIEGLKVYDYSFGTEHKFGRHSWSTKPSTIINWSADTLCLMNAARLSDYELSFVLCDIWKHCRKGKLGSIAFNVVESAWRFESGRAVPDDRLYWMFLNGIPSLRDFTMFVAKEDYLNTRLMMKNLKMEFLDPTETGVRHKKYLAEAEREVETTLNELAKLKKIKAPLPAFHFCEMITVQDEDEYLE